MTDAIIALGGNLGDVREAISRAIARLQSHPQIEVTARSRIYKTSPVGKYSGGPFLNSAALISTDLTGNLVLDFLQQIEYEEGRERTVSWGPHPIDLDLIALGDQVLFSDRLMIPHPACFYRRFVLDPVVEIAPQAVHSASNFSFAELRARLLARPFQVSVLDDHELWEQLSSQYDSKLVQFIESESASAVIQFQTHSSQSHGFNVVRMEGGDSAGQAHQILIAATDEPVLLDS